MTTMPSNFRCVNGHFGYIELFHRSDKLASSDARSEGTLSGINIRACVNIDYMQIYFGIIQRFCLSFAQKNFASIHAVD